MARPAERSRPMWRVALRRPQAADGAAVTPWLGEALDAIAGYAVGIRRLSLDQLVQSLGPGQECRLITLATDQPVGLVITSPINSDCSTIDALAIAAGSRNLGLGAEAIYRLEEAEGTRSLLAGVPARNGLAIYFWLRVGYAPIFPHKPAPALVSDRIWMSRPRGSC